MFLIVQLHFRRKGGYWGRFGRPDGLGISILETVIQYRRGSIHNVNGLVNISISLYFIVSV